MSTKSKSYRLSSTDTFRQTFGGEGHCDDFDIDDYGFSFGEVSIYGITGKELSKFVCSAMNHLMVNGHRFEFVNTGHQDLQQEVREIM